MRSAARSSLAIDSPEAPEGHKGIGLLNSSRMGFFELCDNGPFVPWALCMFLSHINTLLRVGYHCSGSDFAVMSPPLRCF